MTASPAPIRHHRSEIREQTTTFDILESQLDRAVVARSPVRDFSGEDNDSNVHQQYETSKSNASYDDLEAALRGLEKENADLKAANAGVISENAGLKSEIAELKMNHSRAIAEKDTEYFYLDREYKEVNKRLETEKEQIRASLKADIEQISEIAKADKIDAKLARGEAEAAVAQAAMLRREVFNAKQEIERMHNSADLVKKDFYDPKIVFETRHASFADDITKTISLRDNVMITHIKEAVTSAIAAKRVEEAASLDSTSVMDSVLIATRDNIRQSPDLHIPSAVTSALNSVLTPALSSTQEKLFTSLDDALTSSISSAYGKVVGSGSDVFELEPTKIIDTLADLVHDILATPADFFDS